MPISELTRNRLAESTASALNRDREAQAEVEKLVSVPPATVDPRIKGSYVGAPAVFALELECRLLCEAFNVSACYLVGSSLERHDWRDIDVRLLLSDEEFSVLFPYAHAGLWEQDPRWLLMTVSISRHISALTGLPIDFQFQPQTHANDRHKGRRSAIGIRIAPKDETQ